MTDALRRIGHAWWTTARRLARRRAATGLALALLTLGVGLFVAFFSLLDRALLSGLPFPGGERLVAFSTRDAPGWPMPLDDYRAIEAGQATLAWVRPFRTFTVMLTRGDSTLGLIGSYVPADLFTRLGVEPALGRGFDAADADPGSPPAVLISHRLWHGVYGADPGILGETLVLNREPSVVVGIMPPGFRFPLRHDVWGVFGRKGREWEEGDVFGIAALAPGVDRALARADLARVAASLDAERPLGEARFASLDTYARANLGDRSRGALRAMALAALGLLALTCANLANLRLGESLRRRPELTARLALGARHRDLVGLLVVENLVLGVAASVLGLGLAYASTETVGPALLQGSGLEQLFWVEAKLDLGAAALAVPCAMGASLLGALAPVAAVLARVRGGVLLASDRSRTHTASSWSRGLVSFQLGLCFALMVAAGLWGAQARDLLAHDLGFRVAGLSSIPVSTYQAGFEDPAERHALLSRLARELAADPTVQAVAYASASPWAYVRRQMLGTEAPVDAATAPRAEILEVSPAFFATLEIPLRAGRVFTAVDTAEHQVAVVSRTLAERLFPGGALDRFLTLGDGRRSAPRRLRIVGVVEDLGFDRVADDDHDLAVYLPASEPGVRAFVLVRSRPGVPAARPLVESALARTAPLVGTFDELRAADAVASRAWTERRMGQIFGLFGLAALLVTVGGIYAVIALMVGRRERELGIRAAVGARPGDLQRLVLGEGLRQLALGLLFGLLALWLGGHLLDRILVATLEPNAPVLLAAALVAALATLAGTWIPARRAARVDPMRCLGSE